MKTIAAIAIGAALLATPALAQTASGGASGGGADQGGTGAPGGGTGTPGAIVTDQTKTGIGTSSTSKQAPKVPANGADGTAQPAAPAQ